MCPTPGVYWNDKGTGARYAEVGLGACVFGVGSSLQLGEDKDGNPTSTGLIGKSPPSKSYPGKAEGACRNLCSANQRCGGYDLSKGASACTIYLTGEGVPLVGNRGSQANRASRCRVKLGGDSAPYKGKYANLGGFPCQVRGGTLGQKFYPKTDASKCKTLCDANDECGGYTVSKWEPSNCMLWLRPRGIDVQGGGKWNKQVAGGSCLVKVIPGQMQFKSRTTVVGGAPEDTFEDGTPISSGDSMGAYRRRRTETGARPGFDPAPPGRGGKLGRKGKGLL